MNSLEYFNKLGFKTLNEVQKKIINIKNKNILCVAPCGSGKTEASHSKILEWNKKAIMIQPQTTLATSIYNRLNEYHTKLRLKKWTIQHSNIPEDKFLQNDFCVTTIDQVLSGYLYIGKQSAIRGKNVLMSNLVFDEVQLFEPNKTLLTTINMLDEINKVGNKFIIMTATMPQYLIDFLKDRYDMEVIICEEESLKNRNVDLSYTNELNYGIINKRQQKQIIICNTQPQQEEILNNIIDKNRCIVLNSKMLPTDRRQIEKELTQYFNKDSPPNNKILITTQIVEAGMDISADYLYSANCPIDNLVQRCGRCCRWGGSGQVEVFYTDDKVYDKEIVATTNQYMIKNPHINFTWKIQKQWINEILNPFYEKYINNKELKKNKRLFKECSRGKLIRGIENINLIVDHNISKESFNKESISIHINILKKLFQSNKLYILDKHTVKQIKYNQINIGDTVLIEGNDCIYDKLGFRYKEGSQCNSFNYYIDKNNITYNDYVYETWLHHAESVRSLLEYNIEQEQFNENIVKNKQDIAFWLGLHDLGKLDEEWVNGAGLLENKPLAHFPFRKGIIHSKNRNHAYISAYILKDLTSNLLYNVILQHHKRFNIDIRNPQGIDTYKLHNTYKNILQEYGLQQIIKNENTHILIQNNDIITPVKDSWVEFLYLEGLFMETEIQAITDYINLHKVA